MIRAQHPTTDIRPFEAANCADLGDVGPSLYLGGAGRDSLGWAAALGAADYKIRRATARDFMQAQPDPDDTHLLDRTPATSHRTSHSSWRNSSEV